MKKFKLIAGFLALILTFAGGNLIAADDTTIAPTDSAKPAAVTPADPIKMLHEITVNVLNALKQNKDPNDLQGIYSLVNKFILPYVDFNEMSEWVAGRNIWRKASEQNRQEFVNAFKILVVRTYATALNSYTNEKVEFSKQNPDLTKNRIQISSVIVREGKENIRLNYRLVKHNNKWYVYDVIIEGVSILQGFQAQFSDKIRQQGLVAVTKQIQEHNRLKNG
jgi:phospholipid transport system substrate-binding protein